jgi:hypothetical protein
MESRVGAWLSSKGGALERDGARQRDAVRRYFTL